MSSSAASGEATDSTYRSWAVQPAAEHVASELWHERGVEVYDVSLETYAGELARLTAALVDVA